ncbi:MAG: hypothetical protein LBL62_01910 [Planctomycetaceae bacterium]|nr:hypothetical protein [Planctomycetaceae bacterium]
MTRITNIIVMIILGCFCGCTAKGIPVVSVTGTVTYQGKPIANALVAFIPQSSELRGASAMTKDNGTFTLLTQGAATSGAMAGEYKILVSKFIEVDNFGKEVIREPSGPYNPNNPPPLQIQYPQKNLLPEKYNNAETTPLTANITKGKNHLVLQLDD